MSPKVITLQPAGIFDGTKADDFRQQINAALESDADLILLDCQHLNFIDSSGLGVLVVALKAVRAAGRQLFLCSINHQIKTLFELTDTYQLFDIYEDRTAFETMLSEQS